MYRPTWKDLAWFDFILSLVADGGMLMMPNSGLFYKLDKKHKMLTLMNPIVLSDTESKQTHDRTRIVASHFGYKVGVEQ